MFWLIGGWLVLGSVGSVFMLIADRVSAPSAPKWFKEGISKMTYFVLGLVGGILVFLLGIAGLILSFFVFPKSRRHLRN